MRPGAIRCLCVCLAFFTSAGGSLAARGASVTLGPDRDNTLFESATGALSNGAGPSLFAGVTDDGPERRGLIHFDIASIVPVGATIQSASLDLNLSRSNAPQATAIELHRVLADWGEGASDSSTGGSAGGQGAPAATGDATWLHRFFDAVRWTNPGGDFASDVSSSIQVSQNGHYVFSGDALRDDVQTFLDNPAGNFGWLILGIGQARRFDSRENSDADVTPKLVLSFTGAGPAIPLPPALPGGAALLMLGMVFHVRSRIRQSRGKTAG
jgi:hypothetical protein